MKNKTKQNTEGLEIFLPVILLLFPRCWQMIQQFWIRDKRLRYLWHSKHSKHNVVWVLAPLQVPLGCDRAVQMGAVRVVGGITPRNTELDDATAFIMKGKCAFSLSGGRHCPIPQGRLLQVRLQQKSCQGLAFLALLGRTCKDT